MNREQHIDGLRGWAALIVVVSHFLCAFYPATDTLLVRDVHESELELMLSVTPFNLLYNGNFAVCLFFVMSGYVLSTSFFTKQNNDVVYSSAYRRYFRLMIPVFLTSFFYYLFLVEGWFVLKETSIAFSSSWLQKMWNAEPGLYHFFKSTLYDLIVHPNIEPPYNPALWSIGVELKGSCLVYAFLLVIGNNRFRWMGYIGLILLTLKSYYVLFITGVLLNDLVHQKKLNQPPVWCTVLLLLVACYFGSYKYTQTTTLWRALDGLRGIIKPQAIGAACLFYVCIQSRIAYRLLSTRASTLLGEISYSLYLIHLLVIGSVSGIFFQLFYSDMTLAYHLATGLTFVLTIAVSLLFAKLCTKWIDAKGVAFSKWFYALVFR